MELARCYNEKRASGNGVLHGQFPQRHGRNRVVLPADAAVANHTLVILGDVEANYYLNQRDIYVKEQLNAYGPTVLCIHGNHECRPAHAPDYLLQE